MNTAPIISKVWSFCTTLRDDGVGYGDYLEQLTYLIFLKMADEYAKPPYNRNVGIPAEYNWQSLKSKRGSELEGHYIALLHELGTKTGMLGQIFTKAQNKIQDPAKHHRLVARPRRPIPELPSLDRGHEGTRAAGCIDRAARGGSRRTPPSPGRFSLSNPAPKNSTLRTDLEEGP